LYLLFPPLTLLAAENGEAVSVRVEEAVQLEIFPKTWFPGTVMGRHDSKIAAEVEGRLEQVLDVGDRVLRGDKLANIESLTLSLYVAEMEAEILPREARLEFLQREVKRLSKLAEQNNAARNRLDEVSSQFKQTRGELTVAKARLAQARDQLARTVLYAPFDGVVTDRYKSEGERVEKGDQVVRLVNISELEIRVRAPQDAITNLQVNGDLEVKDAHHTGKAQLRTYVPVGDERSRLFELRLSFNQPEWMSGHAVRVSVPVSAPRQVTAVPRDALVIRQNNVSVFRINGDNIAEFVAVKTGWAKEQLIEVIGDVSPGDKIVIRGNERLRPGQSVIIQANDSDK
jgi:RND family efflux transporter MFP subunit